MWPKEPAKAGWSFNKWLKTRIPKELRRQHRPMGRDRNLRRKNGPEPAVALAVAAVPVDVADAAVVDVAALAAVAPAAVVDPAAAVVAADKAAVARGARVASAAADGDVTAKAAIAMADVAMAAASSSRT